MLTFDCILWIELSVFPTLKRYVGTLTPQNVILFGDKVFRNDSSVMIGVGPIPEWLVCL